MNYEEGKKQLIEWLDDVSFCLEGTIYELTEDLKTNSLHTYLYTDNHSYQIGASFGSKDGYLGCIASCRKPRAGESHTRGNDLPDGKFNDDTWKSILRGIVRYELVEIFVAPEAMEEEY